MSYADALIQAIEDVLDWDLPDEVCADAVTGQAALLSGMDSDDLGS